mmetsp:Transcript_10214/g.14071  ORF Transcript_10214/g.14071 Transcript_10214/m.14071 type:complete len:181 (+) Transcript_10214:208-750(+)|eukprot:CAMPEP_0185265626 /NCGR_PEP_ID=MMETSP1359-20130426/28238_1 /TAXON_ID=552665 /ORGANISM="Bigelowiella longifila, Strain CCMP242" /LENGTH=180 /DNA_ID=CAMNT_0027855013 /DNA_START=105 /DNA_END=647 /DNA_ORIENTATION=+
MSADKNPIDDIYGDLPPPRSAEQIAKEREAEILEEKKMAGKKRGADVISTETEEERTKSKKKRKEPAWVQVLHIIRKHKDSRRPASWRNPKVTDTKEEATEALKKIRNQILAAPRLEVAFRKIAKEESDCGSAKKEGDLGKFRRGKMQKAFEDASFALEVGELSEIISTDSGIHIILRLR